MPHCYHHKDKRAKYPKEDPIFCSMRCAAEDACDLRSDSTPLEISLAEKMNWLATDAGRGAEFFRHALGNGSFAAQGVEIEGIARALDATRRGLKAVETARAEWLAAVAFGKGEK